jgi:hypothetical protein
MRGGAKMQRYEVLEKCKENLLKANEIIESEKINPIVKAMTKPLISRINRIEEICAVEKYNLCFIGTVGVGKSTAIANLLGLVDEKKIAKGYKLIEIPLLKTGEGRTTLCETKICYTNEFATNIQVQGLEYNEFKSLVEEFCLAVLKSSNSDNDEKIKCSNEVQRAIRNMSGFPKNDEQKQIQYVKEILQDEYSEEKEFKSLVKSAILKKIDYRSRTQSTFIYDNQESIEDWMKKTSSRLNDGEIEEAPYPAKIILTINAENLKVKVPEFIEVIRDTRGIDGDAVREDIIEICKDIHNFCVICDDIKNYGNIACEGFLKNQFILKNKDLKYRNFVMGIEQGTQLSKVNEADGRENGKDLKKEEALSNWKNKNICLDEENMFFYNSFYGVKYESDEQEILDVDLTKYTNERNSVLKNIENKLIDMYDDYSGELGDINRQLNIFYKNNINDLHKHKLMDIRLSVESCLSDLKNNYNLFFERLENEVRYVTSASAIRASVNRNGMYYNYNLYVQAKDVSFEEFDETCKKPLYYIEKELSKQFDDKDIMEEALQKAIKYKLSELFNKYREKNANDYYSILMDNILQDNCWPVMQNFWGNKIKGLKYRDRIADVLFKVIKDKNVLKSIIEKENTYNFFNELHLFMNLQ